MVTPHRFAITIDPKPKVRLAAARQKLLRRVTRREIFVGGVSFHLRLLTGANLIRNIVAGKDA
jgi:hypothetical protein